jgi:putative protein-disulfide isomerase
MELEEALVTGNSKNVDRADQVEITFYTDPLCCWSWAFEPQWRRLLYEFHDIISCRYVMSGLLPTWKDYNDPLYSVNRPMQMGPVWHEASIRSGMPIYDRIWVEDPPASSYPGCIAVKCAELQSKVAGAKYLRMAREAVMLEGRNIAKQDVLTGIAQTLSHHHPALLDFGRFLQDLTNNDNGINAFRTDLNEVQSRNISRFPTLIIRSVKKTAVILTGYRPYDVLLEAVRQVAPLAQRDQPISREDYANYWGHITDREVEEIIIQRRE